MNAVFSFWTEKYYRFSHQLKWQYRNICLLGKKLLVILGLLLYMSIYFENLSKELFVENFASPYEI